MDTGAEVDFVDTAFAERTGISTTALSPASPAVQLADGQQFHSSGHVSAPMQLLTCKDHLHALAADLTHLPCDILLSDAWMRSHAASVAYGVEGAQSLHISKGVKKYNQVHADTVVQHHHNSTECYPNETTA